MPAGGKREGAGRKPKPIAETLLEGNPKNKELTVAKFTKIATENNAKSYCDMSKHLINRGIEAGDDVPTAEELYKATWDYINQSDCGHLIPKSLVEDFVACRLGFLECESVIRQTGRSAGPYGDKKSPHVTASLEYLRASESLLARITNILLENSQTPIEEKNEFMQMLGNRGF
jgi:hypothetical protein